MNSVNSVFLASAVAPFLTTAALSAETADAPTAPPAATLAKATPPPPTGPKPTIADVHYGSSPKQVLDFYKADSKDPTPLVFFIHGGGWQNGTKNRVGIAARCLEAGLSVVSVEYRFTYEAQTAGIKPPVEWPMRDCARALQFVRSKAAEWNIDKTRIGASGGSAGACTSLWLAFHDDLADPNSSDPIARESTRLLCAAVSVAQTSLDPKQMKEWTPNSRYGGHAFGFVSDPGKPGSQFANFLAGRDQIIPWLKEYSPYELITSDDPPIYLTYPTAPALGQDQKDPTHTANFGVKLQEKAKAIGVDCELVYPAAPDVKHAKIEDYLIDKLKK